MRDLDYSTSNTVITILVTGAVVVALAVVGMFLLIVSPILTLLFLALSTTATCGLIHTCLIDLEQNGGAAVMFAVVTALAAYLIWGMM